MKAKSGTTVMIGLLALTLCAGTVWADTLFVAPTGSDAGNDCTVAGSPCATIAHAISEAFAGDRVELAAGTYTENVVVDKSLEIAGAGCGVTTVADAAGCTAPDFQFCALVFEIEVANVTIHDLAVTTNFIAFGSSTLVTDNLEIYNTDMSGGGQSLDGYLAGSGLLYHDNTATGSTFNDIFWAGDDPEINDNVFTGSAQSSLLLWDLSPDFGIAPILTANVHHNTITGAMTCPAGSTDFGNISLVGIVNATGFNVDDNLITNGFGAGIGVRFGGANISITGNVISGQTDVVATSLGIPCIKGGVQDGATQPGHGIDFNGGSPVVTISQNTLSGNSGSGADIIAGATVTMTCNSITGNLVGITSAASSTIANNNTITGNGTGVDATAAGGTMDATSNWWGCATGAGTGVCDTVTANVDASSFLAAVPAAPCSIGGAGAGAGAGGAGAFCGPPPLACSCVGFDAPLDGGPVKVKKNRVLPFKAQLICEGNPVTDADIAAPPVIQVSFDSGGGGEAVDVTGDALPAGQGTDGNQFSFSGSKWQFNLKTKNYSSSGTYTVTMVSGDASEYTIDPTCAGVFVIE